MESPLFVTLLGMGTVFVGLICIVLLCALMSAVVRSFAKPQVKLAAKPTAQPVTQKAVIANKQEFIAAVSAAIAEDMNTDVTGIRIHSVKQL